jgi:DNA-binding NtrC family response regulator
MTASGRPLVSILIIDDNPRSVELLAASLAHEDVRVLTATDPEQALDIAYEHHPHIVITDLVMPKLTGMEVLERLIEFDPAIDVVLMTAHYSTESAVEAIKKGACDYLNKPVSIQTLRDRIGRLIDNARQRLNAAQLEGALAESAQFEGIIGRSPLMLDMFARVQRIAPHFRTVLIVGGTGTGKDLVARAIHRLCPASNGNFVALNCSAVVETLFESELFGHVRGSFTGATHDKVGLFEHAHGGVMFLDEIGDMPLTMQAKLLRALQNQEVQRLGSLTPRKVDVRVIAATHQDIRSLISERHFREDLYYRLAMVEIRVPALRERPEDIPLLTRHFLQKFNRQFGKSIRQITHRAQIALARHEWPGNVRELENTIGHACMMVLGDTIDVGDLPPLGNASSHPAIAAAGTAVAGSAPAESLEENERLLVVQALERAGGNQSQAARFLRIGRDALRYKMKKFQLL